MELLREKHFSQMIKLNTQLRNLFRRKQPGLEILGNLMEFWIVWSSNKFLMFRRVNTQQEQRKVPEKHEIFAICVDTLGRNSLNIEAIQWFHFFPLYVIFSSKTPSQRPWSMTIGRLIFKRFLMKKLTDKNYKKVLGGADENKCRLYLIK